MNCCLDIPSQSRLKIYEILVTIDIADVYLARVTPSRKIPDGVATGQQHYIVLQINGFWAFFWEGDGSVASNPVGLYFFEKKIIMILDEVGRVG